MKIQCNVCEAAEAKVLCCADEAALCLACDEKVHAANKLAGKHQRVPLTAAASSQVPKCDICQEAAGYFFCLEDRALLCQECDISIHSMNLHVSAHRRFLLTGVRVGTEPAESTLSFAEQQRSPLVVKSLPKRSSSTTYSGENKETVPSQVGWAGSQADNRAPSTGTLLTGGITDWQFDEFFGADYGHNYGFTVNESSKGDSGKLGNSEGSPIYHPACEELEVDSVSQVPEVQWTVPEIPSPPTASGLNWSRNSWSHTLADHTAFVPDVCASSCEDTQQCRQGASSMKRQRPR